MLLMTFTRKWKWKLGGLKQGVRATMPCCTMQSFGMLWLIEEMLMPTVHSMLSIGAFRLTGA
ncbi:hypothetical protein A6R72_16680 [Xanthomonas translucens pv. graminis]|nr:hypothetical protein A6R72_16680 [Xanthomonas translucens pv. graminis]